MKSGCNRQEGASAAGKGHGQMAGGVQGMKGVESNDRPGRYDDIISLPHPDPKTHLRMGMSQRAAQFAPFAALAGFDEAIEEVRRDIEGDGSAQSGAESTDRTRRRVEGDSGARRG